MSECPFHKNKVRSDLPPLTERIARLPVDKRGYPVPFFVAWPDGPHGEPEFRMADAQKMKLCIVAHLCWVCGERIRGPRAYVIGPMCSVTRTTSEPPSHIECAEWSVKGCPFLTKPQMERRKDDYILARRNNGAGIMIERNPGVSAVWVTNGHKLFDDQRGRKLFRVNDPQAVSWWCEGRPATRSEVIASIESGMHFLLDPCVDQAERDEVMEMRERVNQFLPP